VDDAVRFYQTGQFNAGGNKPSCNQTGNWIAPDGTGRTFYVGRRRNGKLLRVYEKGKQLGDPESPWVRWELELDNRDRIVPWEVLLEPGKYVAGAYPCMGWVKEQQSRIRTHLCEHARRGYGRLLGIMEKVEGGPDKVLEKLKRPGKPARLDCGGRSPAELLADDGDVND
jgi:phage replication initiation protein